MLFPMKKILFTLAIAISTSFFSQTIEFDTIGRIIKLDATTTVVASNTAALNTQANDLKISLTNFSITCAKTKEKLTDPDYEAFLKRYVSNSTYTTILSFYSNPENLSVVKKINSYSITPVYYWDSGLLKKSVVYNRALIEAYNDLYKSEGIKTLDSKKAKVIADFIVTANDTLEICKNNLKILDDKFDPILLAEIYNYLNRKGPGSTASEMAEIKTWLSSTWVKEWLWVKKGSAVLNPFDFTSKAFVAKNPEYDETKAKSYNEFIDGAIQKYLDEPSMTKIEDFKKAIAEQGRGKEIYSLKAKNDALIQANQKLMEALCQTTVTLNQFNSDLLKYENKYFVSGVKETTINGNNSTYLNRPIRIDVDSTKRIIVLNVETNRKTFLKEKEEAIKDKSSFQIGVDSVASGLGQIAGVIAKFTPYGSLFDPIQKVDKIVLTKPEFEKANFNGAYAMSGVVHSKKNKPLDLLNQYYLATGQTPTNISDETQIKDLMKKARESIKETLNQRLYDYEQFANTFCNTIVPPSTLTATTNKTSLYKNEILITKDNEKAALNRVQIKSYMSADKSDTVLISDFKYKSGKVYRSVLGAGLVVNPWPNRFIQTEVVEESGKITIKNNNQMFNFVAGIHVHFGDGLFVLDDKLTPETDRNGRISLFAGVGITKKPLDNIFLGLGYDIVPGLKLTAYLKLYRNDIVTIKNNEITYREIHYMPAPAIGINIDATSLITALTNITKLK